MIKTAFHALLSPQVLEDVTGEEFVLLMRMVSGLRVLQTVNGRQQLVELVVEQAFLEQALNPADPDTVDRLLQCTRQALPLFSVSGTHTLNNTESQTIWCTKCTLDAVVPFICCDFYAAPMHRRKIFLVCLHFHPRCNFSGSLFFSDNSPVNTHLCRLKHARCHCL